MYCGFPGSKEGRGKNENKNQAVVPNIALWYNGFQGIYLLNVFAKSKIHLRLQF
jgi:hypothetical protein